MCQTSLAISTSLPPVIFPIVFCGKYSDEKDFPAVAKATLDLIRKEFGAGGNEDPNALDASIQHYVNEMAKKPEVWKYRPTREVVKSLQAIRGLAQNNPLSLSSPVTQPIGICFH